MCVWGAAGSWGPRCGSATRPLAFEPPLATGGEWKAAGGLLEVFIRCMAASGEPQGTLGAYRGQWSGHSPAPCWGCRLPCCPMFTLECPSGWLVWGRPGVQAAGSLAHCLGFRGPCFSNNCPSLLAEYLVDVALGKVACSGVAVAVPCPPTAAAAPLPPLPAGRRAGRCPGQPVSAHHVPGRPACRAGRRAPRCC